MKWLVPLGIIGVIAVVIIGFFGGTYNSLNAKSKAVDGQWAQVEAQYQRRFDLIPNLVETVQGIFDQEQEVFTALAEARTRYAGASTPEQRAEAANQVEGALGRLLVIVENYPQLRSNESVMRLMDELAGTENRVSVERMRYNDIVRDYNTTVSSFPTNVLAGMFGFKERTYFEAQAGAENAPRVDFEE